MKYLLINILMAGISCMVFPCHAAPETYGEHMERLLASVPSDALKFEDKWLVYYNDYTGDGTKEMVAFVCTDYVDWKTFPDGTHGNEYTYYLYFSSYSGLSVCDTLSSGHLWKAPIIGKIGNVSLLLYTFNHGKPTEESRGWMITDERLLPVAVPGAMIPYSNGIFRCEVCDVGAMKVDGEDFLTGECSYLYFYFFEDGMFKEFGGREISEIQFSDMIGRINGEFVIRGMRFSAASYERVSGESILKAIQSFGDVENIVYRKCGEVPLIYLNFSYRKRTQRRGSEIIPGGTAFEFYEFVCTDDGWDMDGPYDGNIKLAHTPEVAVYPEI